MKKLNKYKPIFADFLFYIAILFFIIGFNFSDNMIGSWYQQFMPNMNGEPISDIFFLDSLTGFAVTGDGSPNDTNYILKTTNSGDNWIIKNRRYSDFYRIKFINSNTGFACGGFNSIGQVLFKTTNGSENWFNTNAPSLIWVEDMSVLNEDTIWLALSSSLDGGVFRTTNGGTSWQQQLSLGSQNPEKIYMFNSRIGYISKNMGSSGYVRKTTDGGASWSVIVSDDYFTQIYFTDSLTGWKCSVFGMKKTTDGGLNWITQTLPGGGFISVSTVLKFSNVNKDTIWAVGGYLIYPNNQIRGMVYRTTNGGANWMYQIPDTSLHIDQYQYINFYNKLNGWAYTQYSQTGIHTTTGGNDTFYTSVKQIALQIPKDYILYQNYPNPFNPRTVILYGVKNQKSEVRLLIYDIDGREIAELVKAQQIAGTYQAVFDGTNYSSGIYFYSLFIDNKLMDTKKMILIK
jgi:photosystem II stability/assembly factor-like uncharacterized protein